MIKALTAFTAEIDDVDLAVADIISQLNLDGGLKKNSVGILSCYPDFGSSGVVKALSEKLPFRLTGSTTMANAVPGSEGDMLLTLLVLTSDEAEFGVGLSEPLTAPDESLFRAAYETAAAGRPERPALIFSFFPVAVGASGDFFTETLGAIAPGVPNFGTLAVEYNVGNGQAKVICDGESYADRCALILVYGDVRPKFRLGTISHDKLFKNKGAVTLAKGNLLMEVNGLPAVDYLSSAMGLTKTEDGRILRSEMFPLVVDFNDGTPPVLRAMIGFTDDRHIIMAGDVPIGATLSVGSIDGQEVQATTERALNELVAAGRFDCAIIYSCAARFFALGFNDQAEREAARQRLDGSSPYIFSYSAGEMCPVSGQSDRMTNRLHNYTFIVCAL
jgi:hypothetical protein